VVEFHRIHGTIRLGTGLFAAPDLEFPELSLVSYKNPREKYLTFELRSGTKSQLYSDGKLTTLRCENRKIRQEN
jgi:hypothetical protein